MYHHAHRHRSALELRGDAPELRHVAGEPLVGHARERRILGDQRLQDDELADRIHEHVELARVDLDRRLALVRLGGHERHRVVDAPFFHQRQRVFRQRQRVFHQRQRAGRDARKWTGGPLIRLQIGLEDPADLFADLTHGFERMGVA